MLSRSWINASVLDGDLPFAVVPGADGSPPVYVVDDVLPAEKNRMLDQMFEDDNLWTEEFGFFDSATGYDPQSAKRSKEKWLAAPERERLFFYRSLRSDIDAAHFAPGWATWLLFRRAMADADFLNRLRRGAGVSLRKATVSAHAIIQERGHFQKRHKDRGQNRVLCGALYVGPGWQPGFGGEFEFVVGDRIDRMIAPVSNRLVLFDPHAKSADGKRSLHRMLPLTDAAGNWQRRSITLWWCDEG